MAKNRKAAEALILKHINEILPDKSNEKLYVNLFASMNDSEFDKFMSDLETGKQKLCVIVPNFTNSLNVERNLNLGKKLGVNFFQKIWMPNTKESPRYLTPMPHLVMDLPIRKASQILDKKMRVPENNNTIDNLTGQPTGGSAAARVSYPELQVMAGMGLDNSITELFKYRGGDVRGYQAMVQSIDKTGDVSLAEMAKYQSGVESTKTLKVYLTGMHLQNNL